MCITLLYFGLGRGFTDVWVRYCYDANTCKSLCNLRQIIELLGICVKSQRTFLVYPLILSVCVENYSIDACIKPHCF